MIEKPILKAIFNVIMKCQIERLMRRDYNYIEKLITSLQ